MKELSDKSKPQSLEDLFRARMSAAEEIPSDRVWERIEQGLDLKEAGYYKERVNWYRSLAAACVTLVMCAAMYLYYEVSTQHNNPGGSLVTLTPNQNRAGLAESKPGQLPIDAPGPNESSTSKHSNANSTLHTKAALTSPAEVAKARTVKIGNLEKTQSNATRNVIEDSNFTENKYAAVTQAGKQKISRTKRVLATNGENNLLAGTSKSELGNKEKAGGFVQSKVTTGGLEPLTPIIAWAGLTKVAPAADSLWKPKAIEAVPPTLAWTATAAPEPTKPRVSRWSFSARYAPQYFNQNIELASAASPQYLAAPTTGSFNAAPAAVVNAAGYTDALNEFDRNSSSGFSYNTAATVGYALNESWSLETGFLFTQNVANSKSSYVFNNSYVAPRYNNADPTANLKDSYNFVQASALPTTALVASLAGPQSLNNAAVIQTPTFETEYRYRSVGVPVKINYQTKNRKSFYFASVGLLTNLLVQAQIISESSRVPNIKFGNSSDSPFRPLQFATVLSAGKGFRVSKAISLRAGLEGTQYLTSLAAEPENLNSKQRKPYTIGVAFSSSYTLGR